MWLSIGVDVYIKGESVGVSHILVGGRILGGASRNTAMLNGEIIHVLCNF